MTRLRGGALVVSAVVLVLAWSSCLATVQADQTLPLELAELFPMSTSELLELAENHADFAADTSVPLHHVSRAHQQQQEGEDDQYEGHAFTELGGGADSEGESEAEVEHQVESEAEAEAEAMTEMEKDALSADVAGLASTTVAPVAAPLAAAASPIALPMAVPAPVAPVAPVAAAPVAAAPVAAAPVAAGFVGLPVLAPGQAIQLAPPVTAIAAPTVPAPAAAAIPGLLPAGPVPVEVPKIDHDSAKARLAKARQEILAIEHKIAQQTEDMKEHITRPIMQTNERSLSSGTNYWERNIHELKSSAGIVAKDNAGYLTQTDARCVICQYVVQQAIGLLSGKPLTSGGATAGGKRAAAAADAAGAAAFLEFESSVDELEEMGETEDPFEFLELDASVGVMDGLGVDAILAAEMESTVALRSAVENFLSAASTAQEHSATEALVSHYPRPAAALLERGSRGGRLPRSRRPRGAGRRRAVRPRSTRRRRGGRGGRGRRDLGGRIASLGERPYTGPNLRNVAPVTYPQQLNDFGFEENARNRQADVLAFRPRQARFTRRELEAAQKKWDDTRAQYTKLYSNVYAAFEKLCSKRMPLAYSGYCTEMMKDYRYIAQGIQYGDKSASICMNGNWCDRKAYIRHAVHAYFVREAGDN